MIRLAMLFLFCLCLTGCVISPSTQTMVWEKELERMGIDPQEVGGRNPTVAAWLGLLPAAGSIYNGGPGSLVILDIVAYPLGGPLWNWKNQKNIAEMLNIHDAAVSSFSYELGSLDSIKILAER